jgi:nanoRNase/pAp phosphatase (c-di-AMP/oligoRNAs hydrolase)
LDTYSILSTNPINWDQLNKFRQTLQNGPVLITTHDNPDPDALASGIAINQLIHKKWGIPTRLIYTGIVGRAENRAMLKLLTPEWRHIEIYKSVPKSSSVVFVDCQPGSISVIPIEKNVPMVVIDHHYPITEQTNYAVYKDIRPNIGSTVTMIYQYLDAAQAPIDSTLATAMFLGIRVDTNGLSRGSTIDDGIAYVKLFEKLDHKLLFKVESAGLAQEYYQAFYQGIHNARVYGKAIISYLGDMHRPDLVAELADLLFRYEDVHAAMCSGIYKQDIHFSIRTGILDQDAGLIVQNIIYPPGKAGGHGTMAGGQIPILGENPTTLVLRLEERFLESIDGSASCRPLLHIKNERKNDETEPLKPNIFP